VTRGASRRPSDQFIDPARAFSAVTHKARIFQDTQVLRLQPGAKIGKARRKLVHSLGIVSPSISKIASRVGLAQRRQPICIKYPLT